MANDFEAIVNIKNCIFHNNSANYYGGAVYITNSGNFTFDNCTFENNQGKYGGAIYYNDDSDGLTINILKINKFMILGPLFLNLSNNIFQNNFGRISGGGIMLEDKIPYKFQTLNTFIENKANYYANDYGSNPYRIIFLGNHTYCKIYKITEDKNIY